MLVALSCADHKAEGGSQMNNITISRVEYELLLRAKTKLEIVKSTVVKDDNVFGYTSGTRTVLEAVLGIERKEKAD